MTNWQLLYNFLIFSHFQIPISLGINLIQIYLQSTLNLARHFGIKNSLEPTEICEIGPGQPKKMTAINCIRSCHELYINY